MPVLTVTLQNGNKWYTNYCHFSLTEFIAQSNSWFPSHGRHEIICRMIEFLTIINKTFQHYNGPSRFLFHSWCFKIIFSNHEHHQNFIDVIKIAANFYYRAMHYSAKRGRLLRLHVVRPSVCPPACPSVCNVGESGPHRTISPTPSLFVTQRPST